MFGQMIATLLHSSTKFVQVDVTDLKIGDVIRESKEKLKVANISSSMGYPGQYKVEYRDGTFAIMAPWETVTKVVRSR